MTDILLIGSGGHAKVIFDVIKRADKYRVVGVLDDFAPKGSSFRGVPILGGLDAVSKVKNPAGLVAIGDNWRRAESVEKLRGFAPEFEFVSIVDPSAVISESVELGRGVVVMPGVILNADSRVGDHVILNTRCSIDHDCVLSQFSSIAPGATLGGMVSVGEFSAISLGASVRNRVKIGNHVVIGMGAVVTGSVDDKIVAYGCPAKKIKSRNSGEPYLDYSQT